MLYEQIMMMKTNILYNITFETDDTIITAALSKPNEMVMLLSSGSVVRFNLDDKNGKYLFSVKSDTGYSDGGFDLSSKASIYTMDEIVIVVNDFKRHGFVHYPDKYKALHLWREDYHGDISTYPIALYKNKDGVPHLIYGEAWNHIQIMNLDSRQILTASKSLIEENAEERHIEFYKKYSEDNKLPWPRPYDYFFGKLFVSPNQKRFLSAGWVWGSFDCYNVYDIENFIKSNRISDLGIGAWEHANRPTCWLDSETVAVAYNPFVEGAENATAESPVEIHFYKINGDNVGIDRQIQIADKKVLTSKMYFNKSFNALIFVFEEGGLLVVSLDGETLYKEEALKVKEYMVDVNRFLLVDNKTVSIYALTT